jgi:predicted N-formylglutamate amidohydrolase
MAKPDHLLITCEHGGNRIPARYRPLFARSEALLQSHRGYDPGALALAREMARALDAPLFFSTTSRLLIELNRSIGHPRLYSDITRGVPPSLRREILENHYVPYRNRVEAHIAEAIALGSRVVHVSSHSFTPVLDGEVRNADIGLLYDPARPGELKFCRSWQARIEQSAPDLKVRRNYRLPAPPLSRLRLCRRRTGNQSPARVERRNRLEVLAPSGDRGPEADFGRHARGCLGGVLNIDAAPH